MKIKLFYDPNKNCWSVYFRLIYFRLEHLPVKSSSGSVYELGDWWPRQNTHWTWRTSREEIFYRLLVFVSIFLPLTKRLITPNFAQSFLRLSACYQRIQLMRILRNTRYFGNSLNCVLRSRVRFSIVKFSSNTNNSYDMSSKNLPSWRKPEGQGELRIFNSLTREKVRIIPWKFFSDAIVWVQIEKKLKILWSIKYWIVLFDQ